jgi:hypothetical protein
MNRTGNGRNETTVWETRTMGEGELVALVDKVLESQRVSGLPARYNAKWYLENPLLDMYCRVSPGLLLLRAPEIFRWGTVSVHIVGRLHGGVTEVYVGRL